jgi:hypothetical protein
MKAYNINNDIIFTEKNDYPGHEPIETREFTQDEIDFPKIVAGAIVVDTVKKQEHLAGLEEARKSNINTKAGIIILAQYPDYKQRNMIARYNELLEIKVDGGALTGDQQTELDSLKAVWTWVKSVRQAADDAVNSGAFVDDIAWP